MTAVFVLIDALGWELVRERDFLTDLLPHRQALETVFGFSSAAIPAILTGLLPREHGHWNLFLYDPERSPFRFARPLQRLPSRWINSRPFRKVVSLLGRKLSRTRGHFQIYGVPLEYLPLLDICEKENIYQPQGLSPTRSIFDLLEERRVPYRCYSYDRYTDKQVVEGAVADLKMRVARFYFLYLSELDNFLHYNVHDSALVDAELRRYAAGVRSLYAAAVAADPEVSFYVFSDHGMTLVSGTYDLMGEIEGLGWRAPQDYLALYDSTMARFWFFTQEARSPILERLSTLDCGHLIPESQWRSFGIDFGHYRFGEAIFMMREGCLIHPSHMGRSPWRGMHGFHPQASSSLACLLARNQPPMPLRRILDLFELMRLEAGIR